MPNQDPTQNPPSSNPTSFFAQEDLPPTPPDFQNVTEEKPVVAVQQPTVDSGSAAPNDIDISSVIKIWNGKDNRHNPRTIFASWWSWRRNSFNPTTTTLSTKSRLYR
jgi:hypothetical protein